MKSIILCLMMIASVFSISSYGDSSKVADHYYHHQTQQLGGSKVYWYVSADDQYVGIEYKRPFQGNYVFDIRSRTNPRLIVEYTCPSDCRYITATTFLNRRIVGKETQYYAKGLLAWEVFEDIKRGKLEY